jgi:toxin CptA
MSSAAYVAPLRLECRPSRYLLIALIAVHGLALLVLLPLPVAWWTKLPVALAIAAQWLVFWRRHVVLTAPLAVKRLVWTGEDRWELVNGDGALREARLLPGAYVHPLLVILRFLTEDKRSCAVVLPRDSLAPDDHRRLRVQLRLLDTKATAQGSAEA